MSTLWTAASVTATNGSNLITVQSGEDIAAIRANSWIMVGSAHIMEIKRTFVTDSGVKTIELFDNWEFGPASGQRATVAPSLGEFKTLADDVRRLIQIGEEQINTASVAPEPGSSVKRSENGTVKTAAPQDDDDAVRLQDFTPVKQKGESNEQAISSNSLAILRQRAMAKLERDAVFLAKFTEDRVVKSVGLSKIATSVTEGITYTSPDGITGIAANGTIATAGVNEPPIVYDPGTGECLGLQTAPGTINLLHNSSDPTYSEGWQIAFGRPESTTFTTPFAGVNATKLIPNTDETAFHRFPQTTNFNSGDLIAVQAVLKADEYEYAVFRLNAALLNGSAFAGFNLRTGAVEDVYNNLEDIYTEKLVDGWYLCVAVIKATTTGPGQAFYIIPKPNTDWVDAYAGDNSSGILYADGQCEIGYPSPIQTTGASQVTRGQTEAYSLLDSSTIKNKGAIYWEGVIPKAKDVSGVVAIGSTASSTSNAITVIQREDETLDLIVRSDNGDSQLGGISFIPGDFNKILIIYDFDALEAKVYVNGSEFTLSIVAKPTYFGTDMAFLIGKYRRILDPTSYLFSRISLFANVTISQPEAIAITTLEH